MSKKSSDDSSFPKKYASKLPDDYQSKVETMSTEELEKEILAAETRVSDTEHDMTHDEKLNVLKEDVKALQGGYNDVIKCEQAKIKYCIYLLRSRGVR